MVEDFLNNIEKEALLKKGEKVLLAVSGGIDSVVMTYLFHQASIPFGIAHCNFQLREGESEKDALFVKSLANRLNKPFFSKEFETKKYAKKHKISIQMAARDLRYDWFEHILNTEVFDYVATAHHINDAIETSIFNFSKGTGIAGVRGILPKTLTTIRPMLFASREQIEIFAKKNNVKWREDSSNASDNYARNHIRHNVIPKLLTINPNLEQTAKTTLERLQDVESIFKHQVEKFRIKNIQHTNNTAIITLPTKKEPPGFKTLLFEILKGYGFNYAQTVDILKRRSDSGRIFSSKLYSLNIDRKQLVIIKKVDEKSDFDCEIETDDDVVIYPNGSLKFKWDHEVPTSFSNNNHIVYITTDQLSFPIKLRTWKAGDSFHPLGMNNKKKLSDFMIDRKIPLNLKKDVMVLESDTKIIWVVGHQLDNRFKITKHTKSICKIEFIPPRND